MNYSTFDKTNTQEVVDLFSSTFSSSEGENEDRVLGHLVSKLSSNINNNDIIGFGAYKDASLIGAIFFTRLNFNDSNRVYMLSPVAVSTEHQGMGVGQALIQYGLDELRSRSVSVVVTYGDPAFYSKVGFESLSEEVIQAPMKLSMPEGWLGQSLIDKPIPVINECPICVEAFNDLSLW